MPTIGETDLARMRDQLLFDRPTAPAKLSRFWTLLVLAAIIASAGIVTDSTATVIGAMIVAPLMTPILGTVLSMVTGDFRNLAVSMGLVVSGAVAVVAVGYIVGTLVAVDVVSATSSQVAGRIQPRLIDLVAALATGVVGSFALVRSDVSDTLPGVAIAISLVPPLAVVGVTLEAGAGAEAWGALLLFLTNVAAILLSGLVVMTLYRVRRIARGAEGGHSRSNRASVLVVVVFVLVLVVPLAGSSRRITREASRTTEVADVARSWAAPRAWRIAAVDPVPGAIVVYAVGPLPSPRPGALRRKLDEAGLEGVDVRLVITPETTVELSGD